MKKLLLVIAATVMFTGCDKNEVKENVKDVGNVVACAMQDSVVAVTVPVVAEQLACKNQAAIKTYLDEQASKLKICKKDEAPQAQAMVGTQSVVGDLICGPLVESLSLTVLSVIPKEWECTGGHVTADAKTKILEACKKAL